MEQQQVSIAKAGVVASLPARCSVLAAANPKHGSYNMGKSVAENLNIAKPILSRFDLVFILRDRADKTLDKMVSSNIMNLYRNNDRSLNNNHVQSDQQKGMWLDDSAEKLSLSARLAWVNDFQKDPLPADLVRDYIAYAREYSKPKLTPDAASVLKEYFMELRYVQLAIIYLTHHFFLTYIFNSDILPMAAGMEIMFRLPLDNSRRSFDCVKLEPKLACATLC